jgi:hypothetical protein
MGGPLAAVAPPESLLRLAHLHGGVLAQILLRD